MKLVQTPKLKQVLSLSHINIWFTPFAAATLPIIFVAAENSIEDIKLYEIVGPIIVTWIALCIAIVITALFVKGNYRIANVGTWLIIIYWAYVVLLGLNEYTVYDVVVFRGLFLLPIVGIIMMLGVWFIARSTYWSVNVLIWVNTMIVLLLIVMGMAF